MLVVNLFGGPGIGKSTLAAMVFAILKADGVDGVCAGEFAKDCIHAGNLNPLESQLAVFADQHRRLFEFDRAGAEVVVCDSPLLMSLVYDPDEPKSFRRYVLDKWWQFNNLNFVLRREVPYSFVGRIHSEKEAIEIDCRIRTMLDVIGDEAMFGIAAGSRGAEMVVRAIKKELSDV